MFFENRAVYEMKWKNVLEPDMPQMKIRCMRIACWLSNATDTHIEYVILIAFHDNDDYTTVPYIRLYILSLFLSSNVALVY